MILLTFRPRIKRKESFSKIGMKIYVRDTHIDMIKSYENGELYCVFDSETQKFLIIDTTLRSFIPPQIRKMSPRLRHICGCKIFIISK